MDEGRIDVIRFVGVGVRSQHSRAGRCHDGARGTWQRGDTEICSRTQAQPPPTGAVWHSVLRALRIPRILSEWIQSHVTEHSRMGICVVVAAFIDWHNHGSVGVIPLVGIAILKAEGAVFGCEIAPCIRKIVLMFGRNSRLEGRRTTEESEKRQVQVVIQVTQRLQIKRFRTL